MRSSSRETWRTAAFWVPEKNCTPRSSTQPEPRCSRTSPVSASPSSPNWLPLDRRSSTGTRTPCSRAWRQMSSICARDSTVRMPARSATAAATVASSLCTPETTSFPQGTPTSRQMRYSPGEQTSMRSTAPASSGRMKVLAFMA